MREAANNGMRAIAALLASLVALAGCAAASSDELAEIARTVSYHPTDAQPSATLIVSQEKNGGGGVHAALMITGSEQLIYDPSGSYHNSRTRRVGDVVYGVTPKVVEEFALHQADYRHDAVLHQVPISHDLAEALLRRARAHGGSLPGFCASNISDVVGRAGPFAGVRDTMWPSELSEDFGRIEGVETRVVTDEDDFHALKSH